MFIYLIAALVAFVAVRGLLASRHAQKVEALAVSARALAQKSRQPSVAFMEALPKMAEDQVRSIVNRSAAEVIEAMKSGELKAEQVMQAVCQRAMQTHEQHNCLTEQFMHEAIAEARALDTPGGSSFVPFSGPVSLRGLPVSLKDGIMVQGYDYSNGIAGHIGKPAANDGLVVELLRDAGAIPFTKTNIPQSLLSFECVNPVYGRTTNPWGTAFTCGGSSGGESCLLAQRGTFLGVGTDIGGSVRIPSAFTGVTAIKTTDRRISKRGMRASVPGQEAVPGVVGPMANDVETLALFMRAVCVPKMWARDHSVVALPFNEAEYKSEHKLTIGYFKNIAGHPSFDPVPGYDRAMDETIAKLRAAGHHVVEWQPPKMDEGLRLFFALLSVDGLVTVTNQLKDELWEDYTSSLVAKNRIPLPVKRAIAWAVKTFLKWDEEAALLVSTGTRSVSEAWDLVRRRNEFRTEFFDEWKRHKFDAVLCPAHMHPAVPHKSFKDLSHAVAYTAVFNLLDYPAGVVPVTRVLPTDQWRRTPHGLLMKKSHEHYDAEKSAGLPLAVQVVGLPFQEETVLRAMRVIESLTSFTKTHLPEQRAL